MIRMDGFTWRILTRKKQTRLNLSITRISQGKTNDQRLATIHLFENDFHQSEDSLADTHTHTRFVVERYHGH